MIYYARSYAPGRFALQMTWEGVHPVQTVRALYIYFPKNLVCQHFYKKQIFYSQFIIIIVFFFLYSVL